MALDAATAEAVAALDAEDIPSVLLKGPVMVRRLYHDDPMGRGYIDIDLAVAPRDFERAGRQLERLGYESATGTFLGSRRRLREKEAAWTRGSVTIDLHRGFHAVTDWDVWWQILDTTAESWSVAGYTVRVPDDAGTALITTLHDMSAMRTVQAHQDLVRAIRLLDDAAWVKARQRADLVGAHAAFVLSLARTGDEAWLPQHGVRLSTSPAVSLRATASPQESRPMVERRSRALALVEGMSQARGWRQCGAAAWSLIQGIGLSPRRAAHLAAIVPPLVWDLMLAWWMARRSGWSQR